MMFSFGLLAIMDNWLLKTVARNLFVFCSELLCKTILNSTYTGTILPAGDDWERGRGIDIIKTTN